MGFDAQPKGITMLFFFSLVSHLFIYFGLFPVRVESNHVR